MPSRAQRERSDRRRALRLLAGTPEGVTEALMLAHGFRVELLVHLCIAGLAIAKPEHMRAGGRTMEVVRMKIRVKQEGNEQWVDVAFDQDQLQGVVNGGHTYGTLLHVVHDHPVYAEGMPLKAVLAKKDKAADNPDLAPLLDDDAKLAERIGRARERAMVQLELVAPVSDPELLHDIARARNLSQSVDQTALQNLAGQTSPGEGEIGARSNSFTPPLAVMPMPSPSSRSSRHLPREHGTPYHGPCLRSPIRASPTFALLPPVWIRAGAANG